MKELKLFSSFIIETGIYYISSKVPWFLRGGMWYMGTGAGVMLFHMGYGHTNGAASFRVILTMFQKREKNLWIL